MPEDETTERAALEEMRAHVDAAHAAADRLVREAQRRAEEAGATASEEVPPRGWDVPRRASPEGMTSDLQALIGLLELVRGAIPEELADQLADALRQLLVALRALIDYTLARVDRRPSTAPDVEDIPIQ